MILFLDYDGVLHPDPCFDTERLFMHAPRLDALLAQFPEVDIVLSTSWRSSRTLDQLTTPLPVTLRERVVGSTPHASQFKPPPHLLPYRRHAECVHWLAEARQEQRDWVALDDRPSWFSPACENLVVCDSRAGLDDEASGRLRTLLLRGRRRLLGQIDAAL